MGMGAQNRGATGVPAPTQMAMRGGAAPQGLMALMQQRGKGAGMPGGQMDPGMMQMMQRLQGNVPQPAQQTQMTPMGPMTQQQISAMPPEMLQQMNNMQNQADMQRRLASGDIPSNPGMGPQQIPLPGGAPGGVQFMDNLRAPTIPGEPLAPIMPGAPGKGAGLPPPRTQEEMQRAMDKMAGASMGPPPGALVSQPAPGKGGGMPPRPGAPSTMVNPARPRRNDSGPSQAERARMMAQRTGPGGR